jgi:hypothetical protein
VSGGSGLSLRSDNLDSVGELYTEDDFRQLIVTIEATPAFLGGLSLALSRWAAFQAVHQARAATYVTLVQITLTGPIGL